MPRPYRPNMNIKMTVCPTVLEINGWLAPDHVKPSCSKKKKIFDSYWLLQSHPSLRI